MWKPGACILGAGVLAMPIIGLIMGLCAVGIGAALAVLGCAQEDREMQAAKSRKLSNYPTYKY